MPRGALPDGWANAPEISNTRFSTRLSGGLTGIHSPGRVGQLRRIETLSRKIGRESYLVGLLEVTALQSQVTALQSQVTTLQSQVTTLQSQVTALQSQLTTSRSQLTGPRSQLTRPRKGLVSAQGELSIVRERQRARVLSRSSSPTITEGVIAQ